MVRKKKPGSDLALDARPGWASPFICGIGIDGGAVRIAGPGALGKLRLTEKAAA